MFEFVIGGARSGKSRFAEQRAIESGKEVLVLVTAQARDEEMAARIEQHKRDRPAHWSVYEEPLHLAEVLESLHDPDRCIVVDCLTVWLSNLMESGDDTRIRECELLVEVLPELSGQIILVSNEVGQGIVPANALARRFRDLAGRMNQQVAASANRATLVVAGLPLALKEPQ